MKNEMEFRAADSMFQIIRKCFGFGISITLCLIVPAAMLEQYEMIDFLLRNVAVSIAIVCAPLLMILAIVKRINK